LSKKKATLRSQDPHLARERDRYENPLPSREFILDVLVQEGVPLSRERLGELLEIHDDEADKFNRRLQAMEREGQIVRNRKQAICIPDKLDLIKGTVQGHPDGYGFVIRESEGDDLFLDAKEMRKVLHGDKVMVRIIGLDRRGRPEGAVVEVLQHVNQRIIGRLFDEHGVNFVVAEDKRISQDILIAPGSESGATPGQIVMVELINQPSLHTEAVGRIVEVVGNYADPGMEIEIALRKHQLPFVWSEDVEAIAKKLPKKVLKKDLAPDRVDLRDLPLVTIDGETAKDFDDAVYCEKQGKGFRLIVAIADVSHYVTEGDALDREARARGTSVYFPRRVIPMLPEALSNGLCSLNPEVDRLCVACDMIVTPTGEVKKYQFYPAVMHSHARFSYTEVAAMLEDAKGETAKKYAPLLEPIQRLYALFKVLLKTREKRGAIDFETTETQLIFDDVGKINNIVPVVRNDAHRLIEECMLSANVCAADFLATNEHPALFRVHAGPNPEKLDSLREFLREFGFGLTGGDAPKASDYAKLLAAIKPRPDFQLIQTVMLRSLMQAVYSPDNLGHFGLAYDAYAHFTSPIRRYPDLVIHRSIKAVLKGERYQPGNWKELGVHCSQTERRADEASRDVLSWLKCYYMQDRVNEEFVGTVSAVTGFGLFVALTDLYVEGLVHISELGSDYFHFDQAKHQLLGERTGKRYRLSDRIRVRLVRVDLETSKIDFVLADQPAITSKTLGTVKSKPPAKPPRGKKKR
jgi:ribonuclease R